MPRVALVSVVATVVLAGCGTFTDNDVIARVDDAELTRADLRVILDSAQIDIEGIVDRNDVIPIINYWIVDRIYRADLADAGLELEEVDGELDAETLQRSRRAAQDRWSTSATLDPMAEGFGTLYERGPLGTGIVCVAGTDHDSESEAREALVRLEGGEDFGDLAIEFSGGQVDPDRPGALPCMSYRNYATNLPAEFVEAITDARVGEALGPIRSEFGWHVLRLRPFDELTDDDLATIAADVDIRFLTALADIDVWINPAYGEFSDNGVVPVG